MIGFIGLGNMATAMIGGLLKKEIVTAQELMGSCKTQETADKVAQQFGIVTTMDNAAVAQAADILVLAVKPQFFPEVIAQIKDEVNADALIISIAAGKTMEYIETQFSRPLKLVRCMPNVAAFVGEGMTSVSRNARVSEEEMKLAMELMSGMGKANEIPESLIDAVVGVSGSSPAYVFLFIEALADGAVAAGMPRSQAYQFAAQAVLGSAKLVLETGKHPGEWKDMVCSPGGTTIQAVKVLEEKGFRAAVMDAVEACVEKSKSL